jgi:methionyl-tRNA synthetase
MKGNEVLMVSGSDMHGTPVTVRAEKEGLSPQEVAERYHRTNLRAIEDLGITFSLFTKTHTQNHFDVVHDIFLTLLDKGYLYEKDTVQYYCPTCERFLPDRYVEGICWKCGSKTRGDQCEKCGQTFEPGDIKEPRCINCSNEPELRQTQHYFFKLSAFQETLLDWMSDKYYWKSSVQTFTRNWLENGLKDRAITRDMSWGVSVPLKGWEDKVIYVWFEAVIGYLSASKEWAKMIGSPDKWEVFWKDPSVRHYYFLGKDNIPFHTIIWPAILMAYGGLNLPYDFAASEFLTFKGEQFSKSRGWGIDIPSLLKHFDADVVRYYISANMPETRDTEFSWEDFETKVNNELVATLGNYYHRVLSFTYRHFGKVPTFKGEESDRKEVMDVLFKARDEVDDHLSGCRFKKALKVIMDLAQYGNRYFDGVAPWALIKEDIERCGSKLNLNLEIVKALAVMSFPFLPHSAQRLWEMMGYQTGLIDAGWNEITRFVPEGQDLREPIPLYSKVSIDVEDTIFRDFEKLDLRIGEVRSVSDHPNADKLMVLSVDIGRPITLVAGLKEHYTSEELLGKRIVVVSNLKPAKLRGIFSEGMLLAADQGDKVVLLAPAGDAAPGEKVNSGLSTSGNEIDFSSFQDLILRVGVSSTDGKLNIGREVKCEPPSDLELPEIIVVFLPSPDASNALPLYTESKVFITTDKPIGSGAKIR